MNTTLQKLAAAIEAQAKKHNVSPDDVIADMLSQVDDVEEDEDMALAAMGHDHYGKVSND